MVVGKLLITVGIVLLLHAGYYSVQYEEYVRVLEISDAQLPPFAVIVELVLSFVLSLMGVLLVAGDLQHIRSNDALHTRSLPSVTSVPDFHVFNHRGKALHKRVAA
ncbi:hypothetical protein P43SY_004513 [Pythium insidiosum]|uniref:Membrane magnesium transporter n=1 Tax=Pythium insidiosum TaxID=114742 RepID=A0AAD5Q6W9_PYTIN|nr:hypothetical protein P43SY_004513 [Pythium insidiosum]KAJ0405489.1 hypothetical protein ATCC90586_000152 [Pythium insidiosum]